MHSIEKIANYSRYRGPIVIHTDVPEPHSNNQSTEELSSARTLGATGSLFDAWKEWLSGQPSCHLWTLSYVHPYGDKRAIDGLWDAAKYINRSLWGPRWRNGNGIHATVVAERHKLSHELRGRLHFHVLVQKPDLCIGSERLATSAKEAALWLRDESNRSMSALDRVDVREAVDAEGLARYLTKDLQTPHWPNGDNIFFLRPDGLEGVVFRLKSHAELNVHH